MTPSLHPERRRFARVPFDLPARAEPIPQSLSNNVYQLLSADLSEGGARLSSPEFFPLESLVLLDLETPRSAEPIRAVGRVAWAEHVANEDRWRLGVEFAELSDEARSRLRKLVRKRQVVRFRRR
jgi:c-di-GMP-binding flagellar brake protein YcgR